MVLDGFGPVYVINVRRRPDKKKYIESMFNQHNINNYTIIDGIDSTSNIGQLLHSPIKNKNIQDHNIAVTMSHIKAISHWINTSNSSNAIICEDDLSFDTVKYWNFTWQDFLNEIPQNFNIIQLCILRGEHFNIKMNLRNDNEHSAAIYLLSRKYALELIDRYIVDNKYKFSEDPAYVITDHKAIFKTNNAYSMSLFTTTNIFKSDNNAILDHSEEHVRDFQIENELIVKEMWMKNTKTLKDLLKNVK